MEGKEEEKEDNRCEEGGIGWEGCVSRRMEVGRKKMKRKR